MLTNRNLRARQHAKMRRFNLRHDIGDPLITLNPDGTRRARLLSSHAYMRDDNRAAARLDNDELGTPLDSIFDVRKHKEAPCESPRTKPSLL